jgi:hypothetical protein
MSLDKGLIDKLLGEYKGPEDLTGENGLLKQLTKALVERALAAELTRIWVMRSTRLKAGTAATAATGPAASG